MKIDGDIRYDPNTDPLCDGHTPGEIADLIIRSNIRTGNTSRPRTQAEKDSRHAFLEKAIVDLQRQRVPKRTRRSTR